MRITAINVEIGFGHPNYLDYVLEVLHRVTPHIEIEYYDVISQAPCFSKWFWLLSKKLYSVGAKGGLYTQFYNKLRESNNVRFLPRLGKCDMKSDVILVSHSLLAQNLAGRVWYIHGEIAAPKECAVCNVEKIIVPTDMTKQKLISYGVSSKKILVTGLLLSSDLVGNAKDNFEKRLVRIESNKPLTVGFFISGAYPKPHIDKVITGINSVTKENNRAIVFLGLDYKKGKNFFNQLSRIRDQEKNFRSSILFIQGKNRQDYQKRVNRLLPLLDIFVAPSHEHVNWALGLGIPMFALFPMIGSYSKENFEFMKKQGVALPILTITDAQNLSQTISELRDKKTLIQMAKNGFEKLPINGAVNTTQELIKTII